MPDGLSDGPPRGLADADRAGSPAGAARRIRKNLPVILLEALRAGGVAGVDTNADHLAAWRLDPCGNPVGAPRRFDYDMTGVATRRDAQLRHALTRLLSWAKATGVQAIAIEDLDFTDSKTREKRTAPPPHDQSDRAGHRTAQARPATKGARETAPAHPDHGHDPMALNAARTRWTSPSKTVRDGHSARLIFMVTSDRCSGTVRTDADPVRLSRPAR